jgi:hypothetical protein
LAHGSKTLECESRRILTSASSSVLSPNHLRESGQTIAHRNVAAKNASTR